jgi:ATP-binding cassette, subfamily B, multidrug efflux pump
MSEVTGKAWDGKLFIRIMSYARPYRMLMAGAIALTFILTIVTAIRPIIFGYMVGSCIENPDTEGLLYWTFVLIGLLVSEAIGQFFHTYVGHLIGQNVIKDLRVELFAHITRLRLKYFDTHPIGMLVTRAVSDIETVADVFSQGLLTIFGDLLKLAGVLVCMFVINWELALMVIIPIPILLVAANIFKKAIKKAFQEARTQVSRLNTFVQEHLTGINIVKIFGREEIESERFKKINEKHKKAHIKSVWAYSVFMPIVDVLSSLSLALLIIYTMMQLDNEGVKGSDLAAQLTMFMLFINMMYRPIRLLADRFNVLQMGMVGSSRVFKVLDTTEQIENNTKIVEKEFKGDIAFKDVWFAYNEPTYVLKGINFSLSPGETVAFVGATGAGKSSIINLLSRFYEYQKGEIIVDGDELRDIDIDLIRENVAVVLQDVFLYSDTVLNNITLGDHSISREKVIEASKQVGAHEFIMLLPDNYDFVVGERGGMLSVGQRQLISFIRAYVYNPSILILDEATSSIDTESEELIQLAIEKLTEGRTSIIIAHRLSTISKADKIIVMDQGEIIESGSHQELLSLDGPYKKLFDIQYK